MSSETTQKKHPQKIRLPFLACIDLVAMHSIVQNTSRCLQVKGGQQL